MRGSERFQLAGFVVLAAGLGLFVGSLLGVVAGVGVALIVCGVASVVFGVVKEVTDGASPPVTRT